MKPLLELRNVSFCYRERMLLEGVQAQIAAEECIALIGPNGAGKTTLLRLAAGSLRPCEGEVLLDGRAHAEQSHRELARSIAFVPQDVEIPFAMTVEQFVEQGRTPFLSLFGGLRRPDYDSVERALRLTDSWGMRKRNFNQLSGGEQQRVKIALGLAQQPRLLLLDEPLQHLDIGRQLEMVELIQSLRREGIAILASMHDLNLIEGAFTSVWMIRPGLPMLQGRPEEVLRSELLEEAFRCRAGQLASYMDRGEGRIEMAS